MTYKINKTDGTLLTEIVDSTVDQTATDLTLIHLLVRTLPVTVNFLMKI